MTHEPVLDDPDADDAIPASIPVARGLPPCRAALARFMSYRGQVAADIARLEQGRDRLVREIDKAAAAKVEAAEAFEVEASTLAERVLSGAETLLATFTGKPKPIPDVRLAKAALTRIGTELTAKQALAGRLADRYSEHINSALREEGASLAAEYNSLVDQLRLAICKVHSLDLATGIGRVGDVRATIPGFVICGQSNRPRQLCPSDAAIGVGVQSWKALGRGWADDAKAPARKFLQFVLRDREATRFSSP